MKIHPVLLVLCLTASLILRAESKPGTCCAPEGNPPIACRCHPDREKAAACCVTPEPGRPDACCAEVAAPAPCCATPEPAAAGACCAVPATGTLGSEAERFTSESLYQIEAAYTDDADRPFELGALRGRPVVLTMFFASCGYACPLLLTDMQAIREKLPTDVRARTAFVLVSFDVSRDTPAALAKYREERGLDAQWTLLHGDNDAVRELAALLGVKYKQEADGMFAHSNLITILNRAGEVVHQRHGLRGGLDEAAAALAGLR